MSPRKILSIARKEMLQASRDPLSLAMLIALPAIMLLMYGYAINFDVRHVALGVRDLDRTEASRSLTSQFVNSTYFDAVLDLDAGISDDDVTARRLAKAVLTIPEGFARRLERGETSEVQVILDGADANTATTVLSYAGALVAEANARRTGDRAGIQLLSNASGAGGYTPRVFYNPELRSTQFLVPGLMGFILMLTAVISTALSIVREQERGTMEQLRVTSLRPTELLVGKTLPYLMISLIATGVILIAARTLFGVAVRGPYSHLFVATLVYLIGALGWGLLVSTIAESQAMAFQVGMVTSLLPAIFLSGFIFPIASMPAPLQVITHAVPARYFLVIARGIILKGAGLEPYLRDLGFLAAYATVVMSIAFARLRRREG